jgi:serine/threonine protein kinase
MTRPADNLVGAKLKTGWTVVERRERTSAQTGGHFSSAYIVENAKGQRAFLKAMDYEDAMKEPDRAAALLKLTQIYVFEREISRHCKEKRMSRIVRALEDGQIDIDGKAVDYLIFELADGDIRKILSEAPQTGMSWRLRAIHQMLVGGLQLGNAQIAHQDVKPSNVLTYETEGQKLGDLGQAWRKDSQSPNDNLICAGDRGYSPPELLYVCARALSEEERRFGVDFYMLGSMILFLMGGVQATAVTIGLLAPEQRPQQWRGTYEQALPYLTHTFNQGMNALRISFANVPDGEEIVSVITQMCHPDIAQRGDREFRSKVGSRFSLQRFVSIFDRLARRAALLEK